MPTQKIISEIIAFKSNGTVPPGTRWAQARFRKHYSDPIWNVRQGQLFHGNKPVIAPAQADALMQAMYNDPAQTCNGRDRFFKRVSERYYGISETQVMEFLKKQEPYQLHRQVYRPRLVRPIIQTAPMKHIQIDLVDMSELAYWNSNHNWLLCCIDTFSKYAWVYPLKNKQEGTVSAALTRWLGSLRTKPTLVQSDNGLEFKNATVQAMFAAAGVKQIFSRAYTPATQGCVEKFNGTFKRLLFSFMTSHNTKQYIEAIPDLLANYNSTYHTTIKMKPAQALNASFHTKRRAAHNIKKAASRYTDVDNRLYNHLKRSIAVGQHVRLSLAAVDTRVRAAQASGIGAGAKKYRKQWSKEIYTVTRVINGLGKSVRVNDPAGNPMPGTYKISEVQIVDPNTLVAANLQRPPNRQYGDREAALQAARRVRNG